MGENGVKAIEKGAKTVGQVGYVAGMELTPAGDTLRILGGVNPYTRQQLTPQQRVDALEDFLKWNIIKPIKFANKYHDFANPKVLDRVDRGLDYTGKADAVNQGIHKSFQDEK